MQVSFTTAGIDVGSATSHLAIARCTAVMQGTRYVITERALRYESPVILTPYRDGNQIDGEALKRFFEAQLDEAAVQRDDIHGGSVILTGSALSRRNSRLVADMLGELSGRFLSVAAGDVMEGVLSAKGSGLLEVSQRERSTFLLVDVGGGTTKLALCEAGRVVGVSALDAGARLLAWDEQGRLTRIEPAAERVAERLGFAMRLGDVLDTSTRELLAGHLASEIHAQVRAVTHASNDSYLLRTRSLRHDGNIDALAFSGGVAQLWEDASDTQPGDLGPELATSLAKLFSRDVTRHLERPIRSTVLGVSQYSFEVSGNTIFVEPAGSLPLRNIPVIVPAYRLQGDISGSQITDATARAIELSGRTHLEAGVAVSLKWEGPATTDRVECFTEALLAGVDASLPGESPLLLLCDGDVARILGRFLKEEHATARPVVSVDGVTVGALDHVDIGQLLADSGAVPVHVKSLLFPEGA